MPVVRMPDGRLVRFPDEMPRSDISAFVAENYPDATTAMGVREPSPPLPSFELPEPEPQPELPEAPGFFGSIIPGAREEIQSQLYGAAFLLPEEAEQARRARLREGQEPPPTEEPGIRGTLGAGVGSTLPYLLGGGLAAISAPVSLPLAAAIGLGTVAMGVASGSGRAAQRAEAAGATEEQISRAAGFGMIPGVLESFSPIRIAGRLSKVLGPAADDVAQEVSSSIISKLNRAAEDSIGGRITAAAVEEGIQEAISEVGQNLIARGVYNPEQGVFTGTGESAAYGSGVGAILATLAEAVIPGVQRVRTMGDRADTLTEEEIQEEVNKDLPTITEETPVGETAEMFPETLPVSEEPERLMDLEELAGVTEEEPLPVRPLSVFSPRQPPEIQPDLVEQVEDQEIQELLAEEATTQQLSEDVTAQEEAARLEEELYDVTARQRARQMQETERKRQEVLTPILADPAVVGEENTRRAFEAELRRQGFRDTETTPAELSQIQTTYQQQEQQRAGAEEVEAFVPERAPKGPAVQPKQPRQPKTPRQRMEEKTVVAAEPTTTVEPVVTEEPTTTAEPTRAARPMTAESILAEQAVVDRDVTSETEAALEPAVTEEPTITEEPEPTVQPRRRIQRVAPTEVVATTDNDSVQLNKLNKKKTPTSKNLQYRPDVAMQKYLDEYGVEDLDLTLQVIAQQLEPPLQRTKTKKVTKLTPQSGYSLEVRQAKAARSWIEKNLSEDVAKKLEDYRKRERKVEEGKVRVLAEQEKQRERARRIEEEESSTEIEYIEDGTVQDDELTISFVLSKHFENEDSDTLNDYLRKDAVAASMEPASDTANDLALDGNLVGALGQVAGESKNALVRRTAMSLAKAIGNTRVEFVEGLTDAKGRPVAGKYDPVNNIIQLDLDTPLSTHTLLHEAAHAATQQVLKNKSHPLTKKLTALYNNIKDDISNAYASESLADFVAEAYTNTEFQVTLAAYKPSGSKLTAWDRFWGAITRFLGLGSPETADVAARRYINTILANSPDTRNATDVASALAGPNPDSAVTEALSGGVRFATPETLEQSRIQVVENAKNLTESARSTLLSGLGLEALVDLGKKALPSIDTVQELLYKIDGTRNQEMIRFNSVLKAARRAFSSGFFGSVDSEAYRNFSTLVYESTVNGVDPTKSATEKRRYTQYRVTHAVKDKGKNRRVDAYYDSKAKADKAKADLEAKREADKAAGKPTIFGPVKLVEPTPDKVEALNRSEALYASLNEEQKAVYRKVRDEYLRINDKILEAEESNIQKLDVEEGVKATVKDILFQRRLESGTVDPYFPLFREGNYWLEFIYTSPTGQVEYGTSAYKNPGQRAVALAKLRAQGIDAQERTPEQVLDTARSGQFNNVPIPFLIEQQKQLKALLKDVDSDKAKEINDFMAEAILRSLPEQSLVQMRQERRGIMGPESDPLHVFEKRMPQLITSYANILNKVDMDLAVKAVNEEKARLPADDRFHRDLATVIVGTESETNALPTGNRWPSYVEFNKNPNLSNWARTARSLTFVGTLGFNISSVAVNSSVLPMVLQARLSGEYGALNAAAATSSATKLYMQTLGKTKLEGLEGGESVNELGIVPAFSLTNEKTDTDPAYKNFGPLKERFVEMGFDTRTIAEETSDLLNPANNFIAKLSFASGILFSHNERSIRQISGMSTYMLEMEKLTGKKFKDINDADLTKYGGQAAKKATDTTTWVNASALLTTGSRISQSDLGSLAMQYKRVPGQFLYQHLSMVNAIKKLLFNSAKTDAEREEAKMLARTFGWLTASGAAWLGAAGVPLYGVVAGLYDFIFAGEDEDDFDTMMAKTIGRGYYGLIAEAGIDLRSRINLTNLLVRDRGNYRPDNEYIYAVEQLAGPSVSVIGRALESGYELLFDDNPANNRRALEGFLPTAFANVLKGIRASEEGYRTRRGDPVIGEVGMGDAILQGLGFTPFEYAYEREKLSLNLRKDRGLDARKNSLTDNYFFALGDKTRPKNEQLLEEVKEQIREFNKEYPEELIDLDYLLRSKQGRDRRSYFARITGGAPADAKAVRRMTRSNKEFDEAMESYFPQ